MLDARYLMLDNQECFGNEIHKHPDFGEICRAYPETSLKKY
jgi:hypothetical protein